MALEELTQQSPNIRASVRDNTQTRVFRMTDVADLPTLLAAHSSFPSTYRVVDYSYRPTGLDAATSAQTYEITITAQKAEEIVGSAGAGGASSFQEEESFETEVENRVYLNADGSVNTSYESPCLVYTLTKLIDTGNIISTASGQLPLKTTAFSRVGMVNQNNNIPFRGATARRWKLMGISARRYTGTKFAITYRYKSCGIVYDLDNAELVEGEWRVDSNGASSNVYPHDENLVSQQGDNSPV